MPGEQTVDPAFGLDAIWIESALKEQAQIQGFTVVEASTVVATHLNHLIGQYASELFGRQEAQQLLDRVSQEMPELTEDRCRAIRMSSLRWFAWRWGAPSPSSGSRVTMKSV